MSVTTQQMHLIIDAPPDQPESSNEAPTRVDAAAPYETLVVPPGVSYLSRRRNDHRPTISDKKPRRKTEYVVLELASRGKAASLLALNPTGLPVRVNGAPAPVVAVLEERDQIQFGGDSILHVTWYYRPYLGPAPESVIGNACPLCSVPIAEKTTVYLCPRCPAVMHCEGDERDEQERLECARIATHCPGCTGPIVFREGYTYAPELYRG